MNEVVAIVAGAVASMITLIVSVIASRRFGLPGLAREVDNQQEKLIAALRENNQHLAYENEHLRKQNRQLRKDNADLRAKVATAYDDIATLYRGQGKRVPRHVLETLVELGGKKEDTDAGG